MDKQYTEEELKNIEKAKRLSNLIGPVIGFLLGLVGVGFTSGSLIAGLLVGIVAAVAIAFMIRKKG